MVKENLKKHPLEDIFNIEPGSTYDIARIDDDNEMIAVPEQAVAPTYQDDAEDKDINEKIESIFEAAMDAYENQTALTEIVEPRYAARNAEVAAQYLNTALNATALKARTKNDKRRSSQFVPFNNTNISGSNVVVASRNEILEMLRNKNKEATNQMEGVI